MTFKKQFAMTGGANLALMVIGLATGILSTRLLGPAGRGELAAITAFSGTVAGLALMGVPNALIYYSARVPERSASYLVGGGLIALVAAIPFAFVAYSFIPTLLAHQRPYVIWAARVYLLQIVVYFFAVSPGEVLHGAGYFAQWNALRVISRVLALIVCVLAWVLRIRKAEFFALGYLGAGALIAFPLWYWLVPVLRGPPLPTIRQGREILHFALPSVLTLIPKNLNLSLDQIMMAAMLPAPTLGLYVAAVSWSAGSLPVLQAMGFTLFPRIAGIIDERARANALARTTRLTTLIATVLMLALLAATPVAVPLLFGSSFAPAVPAGLVLVVAGFFAGLNLVLGDGMQGLGHPTAVLRAEAVGLVVTAVSLVLLLPRFQIMGAAVTSLLAYVAVLVVLLRQADELTGLGILEFIWPGVPEIQSSWHAARGTLVSLGQRLSRSPVPD